MIPRVVFKYSEVYDKILKEKKLGKRRTKLISPEYIPNYIKKVKVIWQKKERKILTELSKTIHLEWKNKEIYCYLVRDSIPFSDPLTIPVYRDYPDYFIDVLIHELIHNLFIQPGNERKARKSWQNFHYWYEKLPCNTIIHIPLYAIHSHIYHKFFNEERLKRDIKFISYLPDYKKSWQVVQKEGYDNIIRNFVKLIK